MDKLSDHVPQFTTLPIPSTRMHTPKSSKTQAHVTTYKWVEGTSVFNYIDSAVTWQEHTNQQSFKDALLTVVGDPALDNDQRSRAVEEFFLREAAAAGVVRKVVSWSPRNPNKWGKTLAPWFTEECRVAKRALVDARKKYGRASEHFATAARQFKHTC